MAEAATPCAPSLPPCACQESTDKEVAAKQKAHKKWRKKLNWTPQRALEREGSSLDGLSSFACTDAVWLFPVLVVWLVMLAAVVFAARWGQPSRLLYGVDYELNVCGVDNGAAADVQRTLRFSSQRAGTFPYEVLPATARVAGSAADPSSQDGRDPTLVFLFAFLAAFDEEDDEDNGRDV